jgi:hypothetical protein
VAVNKVQVRQLIADALVAWMTWRIGKGTKKQFENGVAALAATLSPGEGPQFGSTVWVQALRVVARWNQKRKVPHTLMDRLLAAYEEAFW